ncbi:MAG: type II toxin-antitoxin system VapC family toxin, partial [Pseudomonadales bacterium]
MVIDTSAIIAILQDEPERERLVEIIEGADFRRMSSASFVETSMVIEARYGADGVRDLDLFISTASIELHPVDAEQAYLARRAWSRFGKGRHTAGLNYGDCFSYALATLVDEPLLYKGDDFLHTDVS